MKETMKNITSFVMRFGVSGGLLWIVFSMIDIPKTLELVKSAKLIYIGIAFSIFFSIHGIILWRWMIFIRALGLKSSLRDVIRFFFIALFGNLFLPSAIGGDIIKIIGLCKDSSQKPTVVASVLLDRLSGFAAIVIVAICAFIFGYSYIDDKTLLIPIAAMGVVAVCVAGVLFNEKIYSFGCRMFNPFPKLRQGLMNMHYDVMLLRDKPKQGFGAIAIACLSQTLFTLTYFFTAKALHQDISAIYFLIFVPMICVASAFPSIGGLGVREAGAVYLFAKIGIAKEIAVGMSLINFLFMVIMGLLGGIIYVFTLSSRRIQHNSSNSGIDIKEAGTSA